MDRTFQLQLEKEWKVKLKATSAWPRTYKPVFIKTQEKSKSNLNK